MKNTIKTLILALSIFTVTETMANGPVWNPEPIYTPQPNPVVSCIRIGQTVTCK